MKIALPIEDKDKNALISKSLGRAKYFLIYDTKSNEYLYIDNDALSSQGGAGIKAAQILADNGASHLIALQCGENAATALEAAGIMIYQGQEGSAKENIDKLEAGGLSKLTDIHAGYHNHGRA